MGSRPLDQKAVIPGRSATFKIQMRVALAVLSLLVVGCTANGPLVRPPASQSPSQPTYQAPSAPRAGGSGGVVDYALPDPQSPGSSCTGCGRASATALAAGADGNVWYIDSGRRKVGRITPSGSMTEFDLPDTGGSPFGITAGPDRNMWVTVTAVGQGRPDWIAKITPVGTVTKFQAGSAPGASPEGITTGPDGNIWFTEAGAGRIGRMTTAGELVEYSLSNPQSNPNGIVAGPDGNVWFLETGRNPAIAKITMSGNITEYRAVGLDEYYLASITAGPDGNVWFSRWQNSGSPLQGAIGRITPNGEITTFPLPKGSRAGGIATGPDKNIWFTDPDGGTVGRMSTSGALRKFPLPRRDAHPWGITTGADGRMWFAAGSWIANIGITVPEAKLSSRVLRFNPGSTSNAVEVTNTGDAELKIGSVTIAGADQSAFATTEDRCSRRALAISSSCRIQVSFTADTETGVRAARITITDNATGSPQSVSLVAQLPDCKLPLFPYTYESASVQGQFLSLRGGTVADDPAGGFTTDTSTRMSTSQTNPPLTGYLPATYVSSAKRWVPAGDSAISLDGSRYAYVEYSAPFEGKLHVVDLAIGRDRTLPLEKGPWGLIAFTAEGIYMHAVYEGTGPGAMLVNPDSGSVRKVLADVVVHAVTGQLAWTSVWNPADTLPQPPGIGGSNNEVQSRDLATSQKTTWLYRPGANLFVIAATNQSILVHGYSVAGDSLWVLGAPGQPVPITVPGSDDPMPVAGTPAVAYGNGWWIGSLDGLYLWTAHTGAILVSESTASPAGACA